MSDSTNSPSSIPTWQKEFNERVAAFSKAINLPEDKTREILAKLGADGSDEQSLVLLDHDAYLPLCDIFEQFCDKVDGPHLPKPRVRLGMSHLRGQAWRGDTSDSVDLATSKSSLASAIDRLADINRSKSDWKNEELLARYDEDETEVAEVLRKRTHGRPCIVFNKDGTVNQDISLELIRIAKKQTTPDRYERSGVAYRVFRAGEFPVKPVDESPFARGIALVNGYCPASETDWSGITHVARVLARLYVFDVETAKLSKRDMKAICADARKGDQHFRKEYAAAALRYDELEQAGKLPDLKVSPNTDSRTGSRVDSGFGLRWPSDNK